MDFENFRLDSVSNGGRLNNYLHLKQFTANHNKFCAGQGIILTLLLWIKTKAENKTAISSNEIETVILAVRTHHTWINVRPNLKRKLNFFDSFSFLFFYFLFLFNFNSKFTMKILSRRSDANPKIQIDWLCSESGISLPTRR